MTPSVRIALSAGLIVLCGQSAGDPAVVHTLMKGVVAPQSAAFWEVSARAIDDAGNPDGRKLKPADWRALEASSAAMKAAALRLADAGPVVVAAPGVRLENEGVGGGAGAAQVQRYIDADRAGFADQARAFAARADDALRAAAARDATTIAGVAETLDATCTACHQRFWYPERAAAR